jgi:hypothetical protein
MKQTSLILAIVLGAAFSFSARAVTIVTEQFQDYATGRLGASGTGATGIIPGNWQTPDNGINVTNLITTNISLIGTNLGLVDSAGDMVYISSSTNFDTNSSGLPNGCYMVFANKNTPPPAFPGTNAANVYCSFLYRFNDNTNFPPTGVSMIALMNRQNSGINSANVAYWQLFARSGGGNQVQLGIAKNTITNASTIPGGVTNWAANTVTVGQSAFVVVRLQIVATNSLTYYTNDQVDLWINPPANTFGVNEASIPAASATSPPSDGAVDASTTGPGRFAILDNGPNANLDELRIATNWADATPPFGQCLTASITTNPTNVTQVAEIGATFAAKAANSTAPTYQWQLSKDGGATWNDISNAVRSSYTTTNLQLATDNGNKYRVIASCDCDNSSATSQVATITLTAPTVTPSPSLIMNDTFPSSPQRDVGPLTTTHSLWYTGNASPSASADLVTDAGGTGLIATPISGASSLYLGYYVAETATSRLPVHLAVGTEIIATLKFIPNGFGAFTNNGALRFGLFDYADSGSLYTADDPTLTGSLGNGANVRGYMLSLDFGTNFSADLPLNLLVRNGLADNNLMGTTGDFLSMLSGPVGNGPGGLIGDGPATGTWSNTPAFQPGTTYTLTLTVIRTGTYTCTVAANLTGGGLNLSYAAADTNGFAYHRFDTIAVRPNRLENAADTFTFPLLTVQVSNAPVQVSSIQTTSVKDVIPANGTNNVTLTWQASPSGVDTSLGYTVGYKTNLTDKNVGWTRLRSGLAATNYTDASTTNRTGFYRVTYP